MKTIETIINLANEQNKKGKKFPIWGTCLGFEAILHAMSDYKIERTIVNTKNTNMKIRWEEKNFQKSAFEDVLRTSVAAEMSQSPISFFAQKFGFTTKEWERLPILNDFKVIGYYEKKGMKVVSAIEHRKYPIFGVQFHPEKVLFEHKGKVNRVLSKQSSMASQELSRIIFDKALDNDNKFKNHNTLERLLFKQFSQKNTFTVFESLYMFKEKFFDSEVLLTHPGLKKTK